MIPRTLDLFFETLDESLQSRAEVILTGAQAAAWMGHLRPSLDVDFEIRLKGRRKGSRDSARVEAAVNRASTKTGLAANYSQDISHWSMIDFLDYRKKARLYKTIGRVTVKVLSPEHWTIGKMGRFLEIDIRDLLKVIRKQKLKPNRLTALWARAFRRSPLSLEKGHFRDHVFYFLKKYGKKLWGRGFNLEQALQDFRRQAGL